MSRNWEVHKKWCDNYGFPWLIINNKFYWQTYIQTAEIDEEGKLHWHSHCFFDFLVRVFKGG